MRPAVLTPFIIATALFMENMDGTVLSTSLPAIAADLHQDPIVLKLALTAYMLTLAVFIPASGWVADRFGARTVFCSAIATFTLGSILCGASGSLLELIAARVFQGLGGAMMVPVGRLVLLRSVEKSELVRALAYLTIPAMIGPVVGPPLGGFITTYFHWRWIFWINVPIGALGIGLALAFIDNLRAEQVAQFDFLGFFLSGAGLATFIFGLTLIGRGLVPASADAALIALGLALLVAYVRHARRDPNAILDLGLLRTPTFFASAVGGLIFRIGIGAIPFLLPLMLQTRFRPDALRVGLAHFRGRRRRDGDEILGERDPAPVRISAGADRHRPDQRRLSRFLRALHADDPGLGDPGAAAPRWILPFARIHRAQRDRLCRHPPRQDEPRHQLLQRFATDVADGRGGGGRCGDRNRSSSCMTIPRSSRAISAAPSSSSR